MINLTVQNGLHEAAGTLVARGSMLQRVACRVAPGCGRDRRCGAELAIVRLAQQPTALPWCACQRRKDCARTLVPYPGPTRVFSSGRLAARSGARSGRYRRVYAAPDSVYAALLGHVGPGRRRHCRAPRDASIGQRRDDILDRHLSAVRFHNLDDGLGPLPGRGSGDGSRVTAMREGFAERSLRGFQACDPGAQAGVLGLCRGEFGGHLGRVRA